MTAVEETENTAVVYPMLGTRVPEAASAEIRGLGPVLTKVTFFVSESSARSMLLVVLGGDPPTCRAAPLQIAAATSERAPASRHTLRDTASRRVSPLMNRAGVLGAEEATEEAARRKAAREAVERAEAAARAKAAREARTRHRDKLDSDALEYWHRQSKTAAQYAVVPAAAEAAAVETAEAAPKPEEAAAEVAEAAAAEAARKGEEEAAEVAADAEAVEAAAEAAALTRKRSRDLVQRKPDRSAARPPVGDGCARGAACGGRAYRLRAARAGGRHTRQR